ncbi:cytochrome P450 [Coprinopsis sp. MPI-PUGE-AT-0042]|nr:cytochrome P450 [Coprinopsis sp. MPI-PUGE-AT-0042]
MILLVLETIALCAIVWTLFQRARKIATSSSSALSNLPGPPSSSFWTGNFKQLFKADAWTFHDEISAKYGGVAKIHGPLGSQHLYVYDPKALNYILNKEQHIFEEAVHFIQGNHAMFGKGLLATLGDHHRKQRKMLNPVFSIAHLRDITPTFFGVARRLQETLLAKVTEQPSEIEMKRWLTRMALELIGQSGLGHSFDPLTEESVGHPFALAAENFAPTLAKLVFLRQFIYPFVYWIGSPRFQRYVINAAPWKKVHDLRDIVDVLYKTSIDIFSSKKKAMVNGNLEALANEAGKGKDIISVLMAKNMEASAADQLPDDEVIGQMSTLVFAATDTTSSALSRILHLLCLNPSVQERLRAEILEAQERVGEELDYDTLSTLPYLDAVCRETLRLYPPIANLVRVAKEDTILPLSKPVQGKDGSQISHLSVPADTRVYIAIMSSNRNKDLWGADALEWKPERWLSPLPDALIEAKVPGVYSNLMTFLGGGRSCIGFKFSQLEMKAVLCVLLGRLKFELPKDKEIVWNITVIATPSVLGDETKLQQLPLIISKV